MVGWIPVIGEVADGINAGLYALEGDWQNAGISAFGMIPLVGDAGKLGRTGKRVYDWASNTLRSDRLYERGSAKLWRLFRDPCGSRREAFRMAKEKAGIPRSQQPDRSYSEPWKGQSEPLVGESWNTRVRVYEYDTPSRTIVIKDQSAGAKFPDGGAQGPHFNIYERIGEDILSPFPHRTDSHIYISPRRK